MWTDFQNSLTWLTGMKKLIFYSNNFFGSHHFVNLFLLVLYFYNFWPEIQMTAITPGDKIFDWKLVSLVFTPCAIGILGLILNLRALGLT